MSGTTRPDDVLAALHMLTMAVARSDTLLDQEEMWEPFSRAVNLIARVKGEIALAGQSERAEA